MDNTFEPSAPLNMAVFHQNLLDHGVDPKFAADLTIVYIKAEQAAYDRAAATYGSLLGKVSALEAQLGIERSRLKAARGELSPEVAAIVATLKDVIQD